VMSENANEPALACWHSTGPMLGAQRSARVVTLA
jgi:hypothetical protein